MVIKKIKISNFKSFKDIDIALGNFSVLIGSNASGKSNFVQIFQFLRHILDLGIENAISLQGGVEFLRNLTIGSEEYLKFSFTITENFSRTIKELNNKQLLLLESNEFNYKLELRLNKKNQRFEVGKEHFLQKCEFFKFDKNVKKGQKGQKLGNGEIILDRTNGKMNFQLNSPPEIQIKESDLFPSYLLTEHLESNSLLLEKPIFSLIFPPSTKLISDIAIYDFDPKLPKRATPITGRAELEEDGTNVAIVLKNIIEQRKNEKQLINLLQDTLPFISDIDVDKFADKSLLFKLRETFFQKQYLPASLISDGTIHILLLIIALHFEKKHLTIIEEPERNIHPYLISRVVNMMKDAAQNKQIIITTHNPEIVKYAELENILFISRDKDGFSTISRPIDKQEIQTFLQNEIGIEELFIQNLLGI